jgi:MFS family permease
VSTDAAVSLRQANVTLGILMACSGLATSTWMARFPSVRDTLGISSAAMSWILLLVAVGALGIVVFGGALVVRFGERPLHVAGTHLTTVAFGLIIGGLLIRSMPLVAFGAGVNAAATSMVGMPINTTAAAIELRAGHSMLPRFHGIYGFGCLAGAGIAAMVSRLGVGPVWNYAVVAVVVWVVRLVVVRHSAIPPKAAGPAGRSPQGTQAGDRPTAVETARGAMRAWLERRTWTIAFLVFLFTVAEAAANNWMTLGVVDGMATTEAVGALTYAVFQVAYSLMRFFGGHLTDRFGRPAALAISALVGLAGIVVFSLASSMAEVEIGAVLWGLGVALAFPEGVAAVGGDPLRRPGRVAVVSSVSALAGQGAPPLMGWISAYTELRVVFLWVAGLLGLALVLTGLIRRDLAGDGATARLAE